MKRTRIEVISVSRRVVSITGSDVRAASIITDLDVLLSALSDVVSPEELRRDLNEGGVETLRPHFQPLRPRLARMREYFSHKFKIKE